MADADHLALLQQGVGAWNAWRAEKPSVTPNLSGANLTEGAWQSNQSAGQSGVYNGAVPASTLQQHSIDSLTNDYHWSLINTCHQFGITVIVTSAW